MCVPRRPICDVIYDEKCSANYEDKCFTEYREECTDEPADLPSYMKYFFFPNFQACFLPFASIFCRSFYCLVKNFSPFLPKNETFKFARFKNKPG